ncbi:predicted protein [Sclerotinia sclerotiorum 1980 UF-70]|uniref:Uncharacterized protein n=1 Tax=Sclerotinia sclerotiorum (strain ATCC 18683 / 1980 / Ss-1) TaxID=665079 RepID=A7E5A8_SCLS1|nr:predicted protein [Sclerotinia sclerotiorum 1980 UF-70]EDN91080.1 predicted protein [Sclerotinia sclerotiorum 1980 UF-70]
MNLGRDGFSDTFIVNLSLQRTLILALANLIKVTSNFHLSTKFQNDPSKHPSSLNDLY